MEGKTGNIVVMREVPEGENVETKIRKSIDTRFEREQKAFRAAMAWKLLSNTESFWENVKFEGTNWVEVYFKQFNEQKSW